MLVRNWQRSPIQEAIRVEYFQNLGVRPLDNQYTGKEESCGSVAPVFYLLKERGESVAMLFSDPQK